MIVVSDTTPIISLLKMNRLQLLNGLFGRVCIPFAVFEELTGNPNYQDEVSILRGSDFIQVEEVANAGDVQAIKNDGLLSYHEIIDCVFSLRRNHRRISENLLMDLMKEIERIESSR